MYMLCMWNEALAVGRKVEPLLLLLLAMLLISHHHLRVCLCVCVQRRSHISEFVRASSSSTIQRLQQNHTLAWR